MKKILFVVPDFYPNSTGFANASLNFINVIKRYGEKNYEIYVFTSVKLGNSQELDGIKIIRYTPCIPNRNIFHLIYLSSIYKVIDKQIKDNNIDFIFFETNIFPFIENLILKKYGDRVYVRLHSTLDTEAPIFAKSNRVNIILNYYLIKRFMNKVHNVIATSTYYIDFTKQFFLKNNVYDIWEKKSYYVIPNTAGDVSEYNTYNKMPGRKRFLTLGKMNAWGCAQKGFEDLFRAIYHLKRKKVLPNDFELCVIGTGEKEDYLKEFTDNLGISNFIRFMGSMEHEEVLKMIYDSAAIILLSRFEGQSMFITEAISCGRPLILTDGTGMKDLIIDGYNGFTCRLGDSNNAADVIHKFINLNSCDIDQMAVNSRKLYEKKFSGISVYNAFDEIFSSRQ